MQILIKNELGEWVEGLPTHGQKVKYIYNNGGTLETFYAEPELMETQL